MVDERGARSSTPRRKKNFIREWRRFRGYASQGDLSRASGITRATISRLESCKLQYRQWHLDQISKVLECTPGELLDINPFDSSAVIRIYNGLSGKAKVVAQRVMVAVKNGRRIHIEE